MKLLATATFVLIFMIGCGSKEIEPVDLIWTDFSQIQRTFPRAPEPIFLYISQDACQWCDHMDSLVYSRPEIAAYLNEHYLSVNINTDRDLPVLINNKLYDYYELFDLLKIHALPAYYFFDSNGQILGMMDSAMPLLTFKQLLVYVENRHFMRTRWEDFLKLPESKIDTVYGEF